MSRMREESINKVYEKVSSESFMKYSSDVLSTCKVNLPKIFSKYLDYDMYYEPYPVMVKKFIKEVTGKSSEKKYVKFDDTMSKLNIKLNLRKNNGMKGKLSMNKSDNALNTLVENNYQ